MTSATIRLTTLAAIAAGLAALGSPAQATTYTWTGSGSTNQWTTTSYWNGGSVAAASGTSTAGSYTARLDVKGSTTLVYGSSQGYTIYDPSGDSATYSRSLTIANGANGSMSITGGTWSSVGTNQDFIANGAVAGSLSIDGGTYLNNGGLVVSYGVGTATFSVNSGLASVSNIVFGAGSNVAGVGTVNLNGGVLSVGNVADSSGSLTSTFNFNGGTLSALYKSSSITGLDNAYVKAGGAIFDVAGSYTMTVNQALLASTDSTGGGLTKLGAGTLVLGAASTNTYTGLTTVSAGVLNIQNGSALGTTAGSTTVASGATLQLQGDITVAGEALYINGSGNGGNNGALESVSGNNVWTGAIFMDGTTTNRIACDADTLTVQGDITINGAGNYICTLQGNGTIVVSGSIVGGGGSLTLFKSGLGTGTAILTGNNNYLGNTGVNGGTLQVGNGGTSGNICGNVAFGGAGTATLAFDRSDSVVYNGVISGAGNVAQIGTGLLTLGSANTYTGSTIVNAGTLALASTGSLASTTLALGGASAAAAVFDVSAKSANYSLATVYGVGTIALASGKTLTLSSAINHTGTDNLAIIGGLTLASGVSSTYEINLASDACDYASVAGTLNYNGTTLTVAFSGEKTTAGVYAFDILDFTGQSGTASVVFSGLTTNETAVYDAATGIVNLTVVPEPGALAMLIAAAMGLIAYAWRKRKN
jgi:fibronectin-binding autotransporter adhesin